MIAIYNEKDLASWDSDRVPDVRVFSLRAGLESISDLPINWEGERPFRNTARPDEH